MRAIDVRHEPDRQVALAVGLEGFAGHGRSQIAAANTDVDDVADGLAGEAQPLARAHEIGEPAHLLQHRVHGGHHVFAVDEDRRVGPVAQRDVQDGAVFRLVDLPAREHRVDFAAQIRHGAQGLQQLHRLGGGKVLGIVQVPASDFETEGLAALRIRRKQLPQRGALHLRRVRLEGFPFRGGVESFAAGHGGSLVLGRTCQNSRIGQIRWMPTTSSPAPA